MPTSTSKKTLAGAETEKVVEFMSVAGLPARGVRTKFLDSYIKREAKLQANAKTIRAVAPKA